MNHSIRIGSIRGITIRIHRMVLWMLGAYLLFLLLEGENVAASLIGLGTLIVLVLLHELGHSIAAQRLGIRVVDITIWPLGGMARMSEIPEDSRIEGLIAVAGPAVNFALAFLAIVVGIFSGLSLLSPNSFLTVFIVVNLLLGTFNLLPAFPMDGGRVLRAWFGRKGDWVGATEKAVKVGRVIALLFVFPGFYWSLALPFIGVFVWLTGAKELLSVRMRHGLNPLTGFAASSSPFGAAFDPRAAAAPASESPEGTGSGFSDADIAALESYRGRLKRSSED